MTGTSEQNLPSTLTEASQPHQINAKAPTSSAPISEEESKKWGTHVMGAPADPTAHPDNQKAASWNAGDHQKIYQQPYIEYSPIEKPSNNPLEPVINVFNTWSTKAETIARNIWQHRKFTEQLKLARLCRKLHGESKFDSESNIRGGFESLFKQIFATDPNENLKKTFACYLSTTTGPVAGTLYLSTARVAFCSDRPLCFTAPSGQETWSYYKVVIPLVNISTINPVTMKENPSEKYIQIVTVDGHDFWLMGFVSFDKAAHHLLNTLTEFRATASAGQRVVS